MKINKEGYTIIATTAVICCLLFCAACWVLIGRAPLWVVAVVGALILGVLIFVMIFFREPQRRRLCDPSIVYAPADGKIVATEIVEGSEYLEGRMMQVSVFMSLTNVHMNWYPVSGRIEHFKYHPGRFLVAWHPKSSEDNERTTTVVETPAGEKILFRQIAGLVARRIVSYARVGSEAEQNTSCGFIKFGSRVDVLIPADSEVLVKIGDKVTGSQTPLARLKRY